MCIKNLAPAVMLVALIAQTGCKPKTKMNFDTVYAKTGGGTAFITHAQARKMKHAFDVWHRNRQFYQPDGTEIPNGPQADNSNDGDIIYTDPGVNDSLSTSVWIDKDVIAYMASLLEDDSNNCDGLRIYFGSYETMSGVPGQRRPHQATIFMVPTNPSTPAHPHHSDNYGLVQQLLDGLSLTTKNKFQVTDGALNHGELCPTDCE